MQVDNSADVVLAKPERLGAWSRARRSLASSLENLRKKVILQRNSSFDMCHTSAKIWAWCYPYIELSIHGALVQSSMENSVREPRN